MVLIKCAPTLSICLATMDHASTCCHDSCCLATVGNHGPTEPEVCHDDLFHKQFTCREGSAFAHKEANVDLSLWTLLGKPNKHTAAKEVALPQWCHCCHGNHRAGIVLFFFFFSTPENSSSSFISLPSSLPSSPPVPRPCLLSASWWLN